MPRLRLSLVAALLALAGCDSSSTADASTDAAASDGGSIVVVDAGPAPDGGNLGAGRRTVGPDDRPATLVTPTAFDGVTPLPLIVLLHGYSASATIQDTYLGVSREARSLGAYVLLPDGTIDGYGNRFWAAADSCCGVGVDDVGYLDGLLDAVEAEVPVDPSRVYFFGHSNGAFMSYRFACEHGERVAAIATLAGTEDVSPSCTVTTPVSVLHLHGTADDTIAYEGGTIDLFGTYVGAEEVVSRWVEHDGCGTTPVVGEVFDWDTSVEGDETTPSAYAGCAAGTSVELWRMEGSGHIPTPASGATERVLSWLLAHSKAS